MKRANTICVIILLSIITVALVANIITDDSPSPVVIDENATFTGYLEREGDMRYHSIRVFENVTSIHFILKSPGRDFDLYGRLGELPTKNVYEIIGYTTGGEDITYDLPDPGIWHLMVHAYAGTGHYDLIIEYNYE